MLGLFSGCRTGNPIPSASPAPAEPVFRQELSVRGTYVHRATGIEFPELVVPFQRAMVCQYDRAGDDVSVGYVFNSDREPAVLTMYLYPSGPLSANNAADLQALLDVHCADVLGYILTSSKDPEILQMGPYTLEQSGNRLTGRRAVVRLRGLFDGREQECISCLYLFWYHNWFIQYRVVYPFESRQLALETTETFIRDFPVLPKMISMGL